MTLLTPAQYADKNNIDKATIYRWIEDGKIAVVWETKKIPKIEEDATPLHHVKVK
jgi:predicted site-specific integrase-resolvase